MIKADRRSERAAEAALRASDSPTATNGRRGRKRMGKRPSKRGDAATTKMSSGQAGGDGMDDGVPGDDADDSYAGTGRKRKATGEPEETKRVRIRPVSSMTEARVQDQGKASIER